MKILERTVECLAHFGLNIPWYIALKKISKEKPISQLLKHQKLSWVSLSANGLNLLTKTEKSDLFLWSIEHLVSDAAISKIDDNDYVNDVCKQHQQYIDLINQREN